MRFTQNHDGLPVHCAINSTLTWIHIETMHCTQWYCPFQPLRYSGTTSADLSQLAPSNPPFAGLAKSKSRGAKSFLLQWQVGSRSSCIAIPLQIFARCVAGPAIDLKFQLCSWGSMLLCKPSGRKHMEGHGKT